MKPNLNYHDFFNDDTGHEPGEIKTLIKVFENLVEHRDSYLIMVN